MWERKIWWQMARDVADAIDHQSWSEHMLLSVSADEERKLDIRELAEKAFAPEISALWSWCCVAAA